MGSNIKEIDLSASAFLTWYAVIQSIPTEWKNVIRISDFSMEAYSQEAMINHRHGIFIGDNFSGITKVKPSVIYIFSELGIYGRCCYGGLHAIAMDYCL